MQLSAVNEFKHLVDQALKETEDRLQRYPSYGPYIHANSQMLFIKDTIEKSEAINDEVNNGINIGIMAVIELDATEPDYARLLMKISTKFKQL